MSGVIDSKLHRPAASGLTRPRLIDPLVQDGGPGVAVVIAPPGAGKTTLLARAAAATSGPVAWCCIGPEDRSGPGFLAHVARSLMLDPGPESALPQDVSELLVAHPAGAGVPMSLFLDDVHELVGGTAEGHLADLLRWRPDNLRVVLGTRRPLSVNTPRLLVSDALVELDGEDLRFRSWEVEELFRVVYEEPLSPEAAAALTRRTGGWAAGLKLFHLATKGKPAAQRERAVAELGGRSRLLRSYLTRTVLDELEPHHREFLLVTSTLGVLTGPLCDGLLDRRGSAAVLDHLASRQLFVVPSEDGASFRYHQVMQTLLEGLLVEELGTRAAGQVYVRSAALLEADARPRDAARAYALAEDFASVARLVQQSGVGIATDPRDQLTLPSDDPWLALAHARRLHRLGSLEEAVAAFRRAEALLDDSDFRRRCQEERAAVLLWLPAGSPVGLAGVRRAKRPTTSEAVRRAAYRCGDPGLAAAPSLGRAVAQLLAGDVVAARVTLTEAAGPSAIERLLADLAHAAADLLNGAGEQVIGRLEEIVLAADLDDQPWVARLARGVQASVLLATSQDSWRPDSCAAVVEECARVGDDWGATLLSGVLGAALVRRDDPSACDWLDRATDGAERLGAHVLQAWASAVGSAWATLRGWPEAEVRAKRARALARSCDLTGIEAVVEALLRPAPVTEVRPRGSRPDGDRHVIVRCLGTFAIELAGRELVLPALRPLPRSLLMLLAIHHGRGVHREVLIDSLWPDVSVEGAAHRLHAAASTVRRGLLEAGVGHAALTRHGSSYRLELDGASLDVADFEHGLRQAARSVALGDDEDGLRRTLAALERYRGDLLPEAGPAEWVVEERERLRTAAAAAAYTAGRLALIRRPLDEALRVARRATELEPLRDSAWLLVADIQARMGDVSAAAATRREHAPEAHSPWPGGARPGR